MNGINRIYSRLKKADIRTEGESSQATELPIDHQLTFSREANEQWSFKDGHIFLNNEDVEDMLDSAHDDVSFQSAVSEAVSEYRDFVWKNGNGHFAKFAARADAIQSKILSNMKRIYDEKTCGIRLTLGDGAWLFNNINIRALLAMYHIRPTEKARRFLSGLKSKLGLILVNRNGSPSYERVNNLIRSLYNEVENALDDAAPIDAHYLPINNGHNSV
jgi:hypothetical protein